MCHIYIYRIPHRECTTVLCAAEGQRLLLGSFTQKKDLYCTPYQTWYPRRDAHRLHRKHGASSSCTTNLFLTLNRGRRVPTSAPKPLRYNVLTPPHAPASAQISTSKRLVSCGRGSCQSSDLFWAAGVFTQLGEWRSLTAFIVINHSSHDSFSALSEVMTKRNKTNLLFEDIKCQIHFWFFSLSKV